MKFYDLSDLFDDIQFFEVNCAEYADFCKQYSIKSFPAVRYISNGTVLNYSGPKDVSSLRLWIDSMINPVL